MRARALLVWFCSTLSLAVLGVAPAASGKATCSKGLHRKWSFHAGAPIARPAALSTAGRIVITTQEGYLHALETDGAFRWSYSVTGGLAWGANFVTEQRLLAATSTRNIYALSAQGILQWHYRAPVNIERAAVDDARDLMYFVSGPHLYAARNGPLFRVELGAPVAAGLVTDEAGAAWLVTRDLRLHRVRTAFFHDHWPLPGAPVEPADIRMLAATAACVLVLAGNELRCVSPTGALSWTQPNVLQAATLDSAIAAPTSQAGDESPTPSSDPEQVLVLGVRGELLWLSASTGQILAEVAPRRFEARAGAELAGAGALAFIAETSGRLEVWSRSGQTGWCDVAAAPLTKPQYDAARDQLLVAAGDGTFVSIGFDEAWR